MSAFLAPIHTLVFNKILLAEDLEKSLKKVYIDKYKDYAKDIDEKSLAYGHPIDTTKNIEDVIDASNIHGWLQNKIAATETRTALVITEMVNKFGKEAEDIAILCFKDQGTSVGKTLNEEQMPKSLEESFKLMNNYMLEGMPCDRVTRIIKSEGNILEWETMSCIHKEYWEVVNGDVNIFYNLRHTWIKAFIENSNEKCTYNFIEGLGYNSALGVNQIITK
jgi:hypothetical protein